MSEANLPPPSPANGVMALLRWLLLLAAAFALFAFGTRWIVRSFSPSAPTGVVTRTPVPSFRLASLDGSRIGPSDFAGKVVLIDFWATWCGPCRLQAAYLEKLHQELAGSDVQFLAIDSGEDEATVRRYVERNPFPYPVLLDPQDAVGRRYGIVGLPTVIIIDRQGQLVFAQTGVTSARTLRRALNQALAAGSG